MSSVHHDGHPDASVFIFRNLSMNPAELRTLLCPVPHFMDLNEFVAVIHGKVQLRSAPSSVQIPISSLMRAGCLDLFRCTLLTESEDKLTIAGGRQDGKRILGRSLDDALDDTKVLLCILEVRANDDLWMTDWIGVVLVDSRIQGDNIDVTNLLVPADVVLQLYGVRSPSLERLLDVQRLLQLEAGNKRRGVRILSSDFPLTRPHVNNCATLSAKELAFLLVFLVCVLHFLSGPRHVIVWFSVAWTAVEDAAVIFVDCTGVKVVSVDLVAPDFLLSIISCMLNPSTVMRVHPL